MSDTRQRMKEFRKANGVKLSTMAKACQCTSGLLRGIEYEGFVTHPHIAARIAAAYALDVNGYNDLVPEEHRAKELPVPTQKPKSNRTLDTLLI